MLGIDEAGRGACIGPMVIAGVLVRKQDEGRLKKLGVRDSKELSPSQRKRLAKEIEKIAKDIIIQKIGPCRIDAYRKEGINLNQLECMKFADIINLLSPDLAIVDCPQVSTGKFEKFLKKMLRVKTELKVENYAERWPAVAAASIIAKVKRDSEIEELKKKYGFRGSGYPGDPETQEWLENWIKNHKDFPDCVRKTWENVKELKKSRFSLLAWLKRI